MRHYHTSSMVYTAPEPRHTLRTRIGDVTLQQAGKDNFAVRYGSEVYSDLNYAEAAHRLGYAIMHQLAANNALDPRQQYER